MDASPRALPPGPDGLSPTDDPQPTVAARFRALGSERTRLPDFVLGALILFPWVPPLAPQFLSVSVVASAALVGLATLRRPAWGPMRMPWLLPALAVVLTYVIGLSALTPDTSLFGWQKRAARLLLVTLLLLALVAGRIHYPSVVRGSASAVVANAVLFYAGVAPRPYGDYLSGFLMDKNVAGLSIAVVGLLLAGLVSSPTRRNLVLLTTVSLVWATGSRTSLAALACGLVWLWLRPRLGVGGRLLLGAALAGLVRVLEVDFAQVGVFAERAGTDALRARIDAQSLDKLEVTPWTGSGLGDAFVTLDGDRFFFHNSYWGALVEGGWLLLAAYLLVTVWFAIGPLRPGPPAVPWGASAEAANIVVLVCALRLGEVFGAVTGVLALGAGLLAYRAHAATRQESAPDAAALLPPLAPSRAP